MREGSQGDRSGHLRGDVINRRATTLRSVFWAVVLFFCGYLIATIAGFATYVISEKLMWATIFTAMPIVFGILAYVYLVKTASATSEAAAKMAGLILFWIALSFALDAMTYIAVVPLISGRPPNWRFFIDQTPWIWLCYLVLSVSGAAAVVVFRRRRPRPLR